MRSASSRTKRSAVAIDSSRVFIRSRTRPGVPMTMSAPRRMASHWRNRLAPPMITTVRMRCPAADRADRLVDLQRQFPRRRQHQRPGLERSGTPRFRHQMGQDRQGEGKRLAAAGLRDAQKIPALEQRRDGIDLDWGGSGEFLRRQRMQQGIGQAEAREVQTCHEG